MIAPGLSGLVLSPRDAAELAAVQGPAPLRCARENHPHSPWHWDGVGTWWPDDMPGWWRAGWGGPS